MKLLVSTVVRGTTAGEVHGRLVIVDPTLGTAKTRLLWDLPVPDEAGGGARGLRGLVVRPDGVHVLSWGVLLQLDPAFRLVASRAHPLLADAHQLTAWGDRLVAVSTGFDSLLSFDGRRWDWGLLVRGDAAHPTIRAFDPDGPQPPRPGDTTHLNQAHAADGALWLSGTKLPYLLRVGTEVEAVAPLPLGTHDARPRGDGVIYHDTAVDRLAYGDPDSPRTIAVPRVDPFSLRHLDGSGRASFGRGLLVDGDLAYGGSSPASVHTYDLAGGTVTSTVRFSDDVREAVHGMAAWPWEDEDVPPVRASAW